MTLNHLFLGFMALIGAAVGALLVAKPAVRDFGLPPYFWILIAMLLFELAVFLRTRRAPGATIAMEVRLLGSGAGGRAHGDYSDHCRFPRTIVLR